MVCVFVADKDGIKFAAIDSYCCKAIQSFSSGEPTIYKKLAGAGSDKNGISLTATGKQANLHDSSDELMTRSFPSSIPLLPQTTLI